LLFQLSHCACCTGGHLLRGITYEIRQIVGSKICVDGGIYTLMPGTGWHISQKLRKEPKSTQAVQDEQSGLVTSCGSSQVERQEMPVHTHFSSGERQHAHRKRRKHKTKSTGSASSRSSLATIPQQHQISNLWSWRIHLPQSGDDRAVVDRTRQVFALADQYVSNYYQNLQSQWMNHSKKFPSPEVLHLPQDLELEEALHSFDNPKAIIKHCLVHTLVLMISFDAEGAFSSLLPAEFTTMAKSLRSATSAMDVPGSISDYSNRASADTI
jgi:hypothetical protein